MRVKKRLPSDDRRNYIRLDSVFPVQFRLLTLDGKHFLSGWLQGFTNNIGRGGICLEIRHLNPETVFLIKSQKVILSIDIEMPVFKAPIGAMTQIAWCKDAPTEPNRCLVGLRYQQIDTRQNAQMIRYARMRRLFVPGVVMLVIVLVLAFGIRSYQNMRLNYGNRVLVEQMTKLLHESVAAREKVEKTAQERKALRKKLVALQYNIQALEKGKLETTQEQDRPLKLNGYIEQLRQERVALQKKMLTLGTRQSTASLELERLNRQKTVLNKTTFDKLYRWLTVHQNPRTGLIASFEGDSGVADWCFIYDQSLAAQAYVLFGDFDRAKKILYFFANKAKRIDGRFVNAYYANDGSPAEFTVHMGPNLWIGIAALQYMHKTKDHTYLPLAEEIAGATMHLQKLDPEGGLRGGPNIEWYSTEHNLDAYAFFTMLFKITGNKIYAEARDKTLAWLLKHTYDKLDVPIRRGKGDATIATDTYAWSIASLGPQDLIAADMDPDQIVEFAEKTCAVEISYARPDGQTVTVRGFDFAPQRNVARGGVVSPEWTAQMAMAFKIMGDFYQKKGDTEKAQAYQDKASFYLAQLSGMIICSLSPTGQGEGCLPYASQESVDTGHGWTTPKGKSTGSIAGTAYTLFAFYGYNPLELKE